jgi:hypothetical protein
VRLSLIADKKVLAFSMFKISKRRLAYLKQEFKCQLAPQYSRRTYQRWFDPNSNMEVDTPEAVTSFKEHFNGAVPIKRARMDLTTTSSDAAQLRKRKEAEKAYGRGRKISGKRSSQYALSFRALTATSEKHQG